MTVWILESYEVVEATGDSAVAGVYATAELAVAAAKEFELTEWDVYDYEVEGLEG
jgi:hypothetical protein